MDKVKISEIAQELGLEAKVILAKANEMNLPVKAANSSVSIDDAETLMDYVLTGKPVVVKKEPIQQEAPVVAKKKERPAPRKIIKIIKIIKTLFVTLMGKCLINHVAHGKIF